MNAAALVEQLAARLIAKGEMLATAESCTGGLLAKLCTDLAGSSAWFERGLVSYSNASKQALLGVSLAMLEQNGAVSEVVVQAMALGLLQRAPVQHAVAISGVAGPGGGSVEKPVGMVCIAWATPDRLRSETLHFKGDREAIRTLAAVAALQGLLLQV